MQWVAVLVLAAKQVLKKLKKSNIFKASLAVSLVLIIRKLFTRNSGTPAEAKMVLENISAFYDKLHANSISSVSISPTLIEYRDSA
jgi:hypothetical protein